MKYLFYVEVDGQESESSNMLISTHDGLMSESFTVTDIRNYGGYIFQSGLLDREEIEVENSVKANDDFETRQCIFMTHVINNDLKDIIV